MKPRQATDGVMYPTKAVGYIAIPPGATNPAKRTAATLVFDMAKVMKPYHIWILYCQFRQDKEGAHQFLHRATSRRFVEILRASQIARESKHRSTGKDAIIYPVAEMRELLITAMSTRLRMFHEVSKTVGADTLVQTTRAYRECGFDGFRFVRFMSNKQKLGLPITAYGTWSSCAVVPPCYGVSSNACAQRESSSDHAQTENSSSMRKFLSTPCSSNGV